MRVMVKGGHRRRGGTDRDQIGYDWAYVTRNEDIRDRLGADAIMDFVTMQQLIWSAHVTRCGNDRLIKRLQFHAEKNSKTHPVLSPHEMVLKRLRALDVDEDEYLRACMNRTAIQLYRERSRPRS